MVAREVAVEVPATSANLGPGFDSLGVALDWTLRLQFRLSDEPVEPPADPIPAMAARAAQLFYERAALPQPAGIEVTYESDLPVGRGLGISAATRVGGLLAANALTGSDLDPEVLLPLERHADNAVPAMFGGLQVIVETDEGAGVTHLGVELPEELQLVLLIPAFSMPTEETRRRLPERPGWYQAGASVVTWRLATGAPQASRTASASPLASKASTGCPGESQWRRCDCPARRPAATWSWPVGVSSRYCGPTSKSAASPRPLSALRAAASAKACSR